MVTILRAEIEREVREEMRRDPLWITELVDMGVLDDLIRREADSRARKFVVRGFTVAG